MQIWISRLSLGVAGLTTLLLALSFPAFRYATPLSIAVQAIHFLVSILSFVALFRIGRTPKGGRRLVTLLGLTALVMLVLNARSIVAGLLDESPLSRISSLVAATPWIALLIAAACSIRRQSGVGESVPSDDLQGRTELP